MRTSMNVPVIAGPTASGKTAVSLALARRIPAEIISADSRQVYRGMDIGTAKPVPAERREVPHHFIDILDPGEDFSAGMFGEGARSVISAVYARGKIPLVVGGSGLYIASAVDGLFQGPGADPRVRSRLEARLMREGAEMLAAELRAVDPALPVDVTKPRRIVRALEVYELTGIPMSRLREERRVRTGIRPVMFGLLWDRAQLYARIEARCEEMLDRGLAEEVERLERQGVSLTCSALNTVGYAEMIAYRQGRLSGPAMVRLFKQNSRRYAKRQMTWFRKDLRITWLDMSGGRSPGEAAEEILRRMEIDSESGFPYI